MKTTTTRQILQAAAGLPVPQARRVVGALAAKTQDAKTQEARAEQDVQALRGALAADLQPLGEALFSAYQLGDWAACQAALKKISKRCPALLKNTGHLSQVIAGQMTKALTEG
jgi:hypothetical protein